MLAAFGAPTAQLLAWAIGEQGGDRGTPLLERYLEFLGNSLLLTVVTVAICLLVAVVVTNAGRFADPRIVGPANRLASVGYAVPGPVVAMGVILALVALDDLLGGLGLGLPGSVATGSFIALVYAYGVRFMGPGLTRSSRGWRRCPTTSRRPPVPSVRGRSPWPAGSTSHCPRRASSPPPCWSASTP